MAAKIVTEKKAHTVGGVASAPMGSADVAHFDGELPSFTQAKNMALIVISSHLSSLESASMTDPEWSDDDVNVELSVGLASRELARLKEAIGMTADEFFDSWWEVSAVVALAERSFNRDNCYKRTLRAASESFRVLGEMVDMSACVGTMKTVQ